MKKILLIALATFSLQAYSQNIFPIKLDNCKADRFCLDCGDTKASYNEVEFAKTIDKLNKELNIKGIEGAIKLQVLVSAKGKGCVLSHNDRSNNPITLKIVEEVNKLKNWTPAITEEKKEEKSSITLAFTIKDNKVSGQVERVDLKEFKKSFDHPTKPEIFNKTYTYTNDNLKNYNITVWNSKNSNLPNNSNNHITIDKSGLIWLTVDDGLVTFDGEYFKNAEQNITDREKFFSYLALATDNNNVKWTYGGKNIYSYDNTKWIKYEPTDIGLGHIYKIVNNPGTGEIFFCSDEGLTIHKDDEWTNINKNKIKDLPSNRVSFAKRDSKNRIWIGTYDGSAMIDEKKQVTNYEKTNSILKGKTITSMDEDENGNLYFTLYEFGRKEKGKVNNNEGIAILYTDGTLKQFTTENSGMPFNHATAVVYDKNEKVLWIATDRAGLVRFDLKDKWENYHNQNSDIPTSYISTMTLDINGNLYLATRQGLVKIERK